MRGCIGTPETRWHSPVAMAPSQPKIRGPHWLCTPKRVILRGLSTLSPEPTNPVAAEGGWSAR